jgi:hypothetical protein
MGSGDMSDDLPPGFVLDRAPAEHTGASDLPPGFVLDKAEDHAPPKPERPSVWDAIRQQFNEGPTTASQIFSIPRLAGVLYHSAVSGAKLPNDVMAGRVALPSKEGVPYSAPEGSPGGDQALGRVRDMMVFANPVNPAIRSGGGWAAAGREIIGPIPPGAPRYQPIVKPSPPVPNVRPTQTAIDLGAPLPVGIASENRAVQGLTQAARQLPGVGASIDSAVANTVEKAGGAVKEIAGDLSGGVTDRASVGAIMRPSLKDVIAENNAKIDYVYSTLRNVIDPEKATQLPNTAGTLRQIIAERTAAKVVNPEAGLDDIIKLVNPIRNAKGQITSMGASFNGLQRARSDLGNSINFAAANPGFNVGDAKRLYAAMSQDMMHIAKRNPVPGVTPQQSVDVLRAANAAASQLIERNKSIQNLVGIKTDEGVVGSIINAAQEKTGNVRLLAQLRNSMPKSDFEKISGVAVSELGHSPATGEFSLAKFVTGWGKMSDQGKALLFPDPQHRKMLDNIANLGQKIKGGDQYRNTSNTARATGLGDMIKMGGGAAAALAASGDPTALLGLVGAVGGGYVLAKALARPAGAASIARWIRAQQAHNLAPNPITRTAMVRAGSDLIHNMAGVANMKVNQFIRSLQGPMKAPAENEKPESDRVLNH